MTTGPLDLIESDPGILHGQVCIRGTRIPVTVILDSLAVGLSESEIVNQYPTLPAGAVRAALAYAALLACDTIYPLEPTPG